MKIHGTKLLFCLVGLIGGVFGKETCTVPWQQSVDYSIDCELNPQTFLLEGKEQVHYFNNSPDTLTDLYFHLYPNAFRKGSIMDKEAAAASINLIKSESHKSFMRVNIHSAHLNDSSANQINVTVAYNSDSTLMKLVLDKNIPPGESIKITMTFLTKIHHYNPSYDVGGYRNNLFQISNWYPKLCVYDENGWDAVPYHYLGEFYGEFGTYEVSIKVPDSYIVAATGEIISGDAGWNNKIKKIEDQNVNHVTLLSPINKITQMASTREVTFYAENVHDFVWLTSPDYLSEHGQWNGIKLHIFYQKSSYENWHETAINAAKQALNWWEETVGEYPYPQLTICEGVVDGGMEYPMLTTLGHFDLILLAHEIGHMYFYGALANNEQKEGWLDEGIVTFHTDLFKETTYSQLQDTLMPQVSITKLRNQFLPFSRYKDVQLNSLYYYFYSGFEKPLATPCYKLKNPYLYSYNIYVKSTKFFSLLDYIVGRDTYFDILRTFYKRHKFRHVNVESLRKIVNEVAQQDLNFFFDQWVYHTPKVDYSLSALNSKKTNQSYKTEIIIDRIGDGMIPFETEIRCSSGEKIVKKLDGKKQQHSFSVLTESKVKDVIIDPRDIILDQNRLNNSKLKVKPFLYPDFPTMYYLPRDHYSLFLWPQSWYNDIDGLKLGLKILGSYLNRYYIFRNDVWYNFKSENFDFKIGYSMPLEKISRNLWQHLQVINVEGRRLINANFNYNVISSFAQQPTHNFRIGVISAKVTDNRYIYRKVTVNDDTKKISEWEQGELNKFYFQYTLNRDKNSFPLKLEFQLHSANKKFKSKFEYTRLSLELNKSVMCMWQNLCLEIRSFGGMFLPESNAAPVQDRFWVAEADPIERYKHVYLRSPGALPVWFKNHFPGDGNLRGYLYKLDDDTNPLTAQRILSANLDIFQQNIHKIIPKIRKLKNIGIDFYIFFDGGWIYSMNKETNTLFDAGMGFQFKKRIIGKLRTLKVGFPLWLSQPDFNKSNQSESNWKFRWFISLQ